VACNVARNLARLGAEVVLCSVVGDDAAAAELSAILDREGVSTGGLTVDTSHPTAGYLAVLDPAGGLVIGVADMEIYDHLDDEWAGRAAALAGDCDLWVFDANLPEAVLSGLAARATAPVLADPVSAAKAPRLLPILHRLEAVFPDRAEAGVLAGGDHADPEGNAARIAASGVGTVVVTLGPDGAHLRRGEFSQTRPSFPAESVADVTGAGDAFLAGFAHATAAGEADELDWGLAAASLAVETDASVAAHLSLEAVSSRIAGG
jgi:pseudouridine kinase